MMSDEQIAELRRLEKAATRGPWSKHENHVCGYAHLESELETIALGFSLDEETHVQHELNHGDEQTTADYEFIAALRNAAHELLSAHDDAVRLRVESDMLHYAFHHLGESWMPKRDTYGQWKNDLFRLMVERGYWTNGAPEYAALRPAGQGAGEGE